MSRNILGNGQHSKGISILVPYIKEVLRHERIPEKVPEEPPISVAISQPGKAEPDTEQIVMQKLSRFKKFAPPPFRDAKTPMEAEDWLDNLKTVLDLLHSKDSDKLMYVEFLLEGEAKNWWKVEKRRLEKNKVDWETFQQMFLRHYFPQ